MTIVLFALSEAKTTWFPFREIKVDELISKTSFENFVVCQQIWFALEVSATCPPKRSLLEWRPTGVFSENNNEDWIISVAAKYIFI